MTPMVTAAAAAFNLVCQQLTFGVAGEPVQNTTGIAGPIFRVDLGSGRFCAADCTETQPIAKVTDSALVLQSVDAPGAKLFLRISRESGDYFSSIQGGDAPEMTATGTCEVKPFTGFPVRKF